MPSNYEDNFSTAFTVMLLDIDECKQDDICKNGRCMNEAGSFKCVCDRGFTPSSDGKACLGTRVLHILSTRQVVLVVYN